MKKLFVCLVAVALLASTGSALAECCGKVWDDLSWWGQGATPSPVKDAKRSGYWWFPKTPDSNTNDQELWGNRGLVYAKYDEPVMPDKPDVVAPPKTTSESGRSIPVLNNVLFDFDKSTLKPEGKAETDKVVAAMKEYPNDTLAIVGHTCDIGPAEYNMALGQRRANAVKAYMVESGIAADRITTVSKGETEPAVPNDTPANRKLNRRAVFEIKMAE